MKMSKTLVVAAVLAVVSVNVNVGTVCARPVQVPLQHKPRQASVVVDGRQYFAPHAFKPSVKPLGAPMCSPSTPGCGEIPYDGSVAFGEFYVALHVGSNPKPFNVQVDSGSSDVSVLSSKITKGYPTLPRYDPFTSQTATPTPCDAPGLTCKCSPTKQCMYTIEYLDQSGFTALVFNDTISVPGFKWRGVMGAVINQTANFDPPPVAGIAGVAYSSVSEIHAPTIIDSIVAQTPGAQNMFSLCMETTPNDGVMTIGGAANVPTPYEYTPILEDQFYTVQGTGFALNGKALPITGADLGQTIVDSGTTVILVPSGAFGTIYDGMHAMCDDVNLVGVCGVAHNASLFNYQCFEMTSSDVTAFPDMTFSLQGSSGTVDVVVTSATYLVEAQGMYCLGMVPGRLQDGTILGDVALRGYTTVFDRENNRLGFSRRQAGVSCS